MPFGFAPSAYRPSYQREPAPQRLTLEELLAQQEHFQPAPPPQEMRSLSDLDPDERQRVKWEGLWTGIGALGASMSTGNYGNLTQGAQQALAIRDDAIAQANDRAERQYQQEQATAAQDFQAQRDKTQQAAIYGMYQKAVEGEDPAGPFASKAEAFARAGNMSALEGMASPDTKSMRADARSKGYNPDAWSTHDRLTAELAAEVKRQNEAGDWAGEKSRKQEALDMATAADLAKQEEERRRKLGQYAPPKPQQYESPEHAAAVAEAVEQVRAKYRAQGVGGGEAGRFGGLVRMQGEKAVLIKPPDATHKESYVVPIAGQPQEVNGFSYFMGADKKRYVQDKEHPELGAFEVDMHEKGSLGYAEGVKHFQPPPQPNLPKVGGSVYAGPARPVASPSPAPSPAPAPTAQPPVPVLAPPPPPPRASSAGETAALVAGNLTAGHSRTEALQRLRASYPQGLDGKSPEQMLEMAVALTKAKKHGGR